MINKILKRIFKVLLPCLCIMGCSKDYTNYYSDAEDTGLYIFSDNSNNVMSCFIDGQPWQTTSRTISLFSRPVYEVYISKLRTNSLYDTLSIEWEGYYSKDKNNIGYINLLLPVAKNFGYKDISALQGKRLQVNNSNGFFSTFISGLNLSNTKGAGNIYFHSMRFDSIAPYTYNGTMSGLFEANFNTFKILKGRFDHNITPLQVRL